MGVGVIHKHHNSFYNNKKSDFKKYAGFFSSTNIKILSRIVLKSENRFCVYTISRGRYSKFPASPPKLPAVFLTGSIRGELPCVSHLES